MNLTKTLLAAGAFAFFGGTSFAATVGIDTLVGAEDLGNSGEATELAALCDWLDDGTNNGTSNCGIDLEVETKYEAGELTIQEDDAGTFYVDIAPETPGWFVLKFGGGGFVGPTHFFFTNIAELNILAWTVPGQVTAEAWGDCMAGNVVGDEGDNSDLSCRLSHITTVVPIPAAGFLLIGGLGGLIALRRRKS